MKRIAQSAITTGTGTLLFTVPAGYRLTIKDIAVSNTTAADITCGLYLAPSGGTVGASNSFFPNVTIPGNTIVQWTGNQCLEAGGFVQGIGSAAGITVTITGELDRVSI